MNIKSIVASVSLLFAAGAALAAPAELNFPQQGGTPSGITRTEVRADVIAARDAGRLEQSEAALPELAQPTVLTRAQVRAEVIAARAAGLLDQSDVEYPVAYQQPRTRQVATLYANAKAGKAIQ